MDYSVFYKKISKPFVQYAKVIKILNKLLTYLFYLAYPMALILCFKKNCVEKGIVFPFVGFVALSLFRHFINRKRPYETWAIDPIIKKDTNGHSMPSRHIFSAVIISMCYVMVHPFLGYILLGVSALEGIIRIIGGVHYPEDVLVGYLLGVILGVFMIIY